GGREGDERSVGRFQLLARGVSAGENPPDQGAWAGLTPTEGVVERLRIRKDEHEIEMLRRGGLLLSAVALDVLQDAKAGLMEQELAAKIDWRIKSAGFERCSFETIVASGPNAAQPHAHARGRVLKDGGLGALGF